MTSITVRDIPDDARDALAARAAAGGRSMQEYLRLQLVELARRPDPEAVMRRIRERKEQVDSRVDPDDILRARDADRR